MHGTELSKHLFKCLSFAQRCGSATPEANFAKKVLNMVTSLPLPKKARQNIVPVIPKAETGPKVFSGLFGERSVMVITYMQFELKSSKLTAHCVYVVMQEQMTTSCSARHNRRR
jgi:hypothetical protein